MQPALFVGFAVITINRPTITRFVSIIDQSGMRCFFANIIYNIVRVLSLSKSYWAARNKIFIYARPCVNKMTWAIFFTWLQSFRPVKLQYSFPSLWNMEETTEELPNFSIGSDLLGPDPTSNKKKPKKTRKLHVSQICLDNLWFLTLKTFFSDTWVHLAFIFSIFPVNFELFNCYQLTGSKVLAQTKV